MIDALGQGMKFIETELQGLVIVELEPHADERGTFTRTFDAREWEARGMCAEVAQCSISHNFCRGTLRGLHYQDPPYAEAKLVRCSSGAIFDVAVDLRPESPTFCRWFGVDLSDRNSRMLHIPAGFAHGFLTLADETEVAYQISGAYAPAYELGVRWDDPTFAIQWPAPPRVISERDRSLPDFQP